MGNKPVEDGGPAFPFARQELCNGDAVGPEFGMSLRDWFAGMAMSAYLSSDVALTQLSQAVEESLPPGADRRAVTRQILAKRAYLQADAMIAYREQS
jgi:hypothetical protein